MTERIDALFARLRARGRPALIGYLTAGYPSLAASRRLIPELARYCDILEPGLPSPDPHLDGPLIRDSHRQAVARGATAGAVLALLAELRPAIANPIVPMVYAERFAAEGFERFSQRCREAGADAVLVPDAPEQAPPPAAPPWASGRHRAIPLVDPECDEPRLRARLAGGAGFVYLAASRGPSGSPLPAEAVLRSCVARVRALSELPVAVGIGIRTPAAAARVARFADAVVVGTAIEELLQGAATRGGGLRPDWKSRLQGRLAAFAAAMQP